MTYTADVSMFPYFKKDDAKVVKKVVVINDTQKKVWRLEAQNEMLRKELEDAKRIYEDMGCESFGYEKGYKRLKEENKELQEQNNHLVGETDRLGELESIAWIDFYGEKEVDDDIKSYKFRDDIIAMKEENKKLKKTKQVMYESIMELENPVTNHDERCGVVNVRCNHAYLMGFMYGHHIDPDVSRSVDNQEEFDGVIEHMSKEVENVIDTYLQDSLIYGTQMTLNEVIREKLDDIIDQAIDDGIVKEIDDSSDED